MLSYVLKFFNQITKRKFTISSILLSISILYSGFLEFQKQRLKDENFKLKEQIIKLQNENFKCFENLDKIRSLNETCSFTIKDLTAKLDDQKKYCEAVFNKNRKLNQQLIKLRDLNEKLLKKKNEKQKVVIKKEKCEFKILKGVSDEETGDFILDNFTTIGK